MEHQNVNLFVYIFGIKVIYSTDNHSWKTVQDENGVDITFTGNNDKNTKVYNDLPFPMRAQYVKLEPVTWNSAPSLRWGLVAW